MTHVRYGASGLSTRFGSALLTALCFSVVTNAQDELRAYRQVAYETRHGTLTVKRDRGTSTMR